MSTTNNKSKRPHSNEDSKRSPTKRQYRNENEKRRRDLFSQLISNLEDILSIEKKSSPGDKASAQTNKLDKASILRETAVFLRKHQDNLIFQANASSSTTTNRTNNDRTNEIVDFSWKPPSSLVTMEEWIQTAIESMNCFFLVAKSDPHNGQIVYVSKNISSLLDYSQNELLNRSLFELILPRDHDQLRDYLLKDHRVLEKCNLSWRRATADEYEQCTIIGAFRQILHTENNEKYLMSIVKVNTSDRTLFINNEDSINQFTTRLNLHGKFIHIDSKAREFLGYSSYELIGRTHFDFVHPDDLPIIVRAHQIWKENGNGKSDSYRFLSKGQQWIFLQTNCQVQMNSWTGKPESYLCTSNVLQNPTDSLHRQLPPVLSSSSLSSSSSSSLQTLPSTIQPDLTTSCVVTTNSQRKNSSADSQITSFLSHLGNEAYRKNIREKLNERRLYKQAEIRVREEEIKVIEDIIRFVDEYQSKQTGKSALKSTNSNPSTPTTATQTTIDLTNRMIQQDNVNDLSGLESNYDPLLIQSSLIGAIEDLSPQYSSMISHHNLSKDETIIDPLTYQLFSPSQQGPFSIPSPMTPFSIPSRPSPITPIPLSVSPPPPSPSPLIQSISPTMNHLKPPSISSTSSSSTSSSSTTTTNPTVPSKEDPSKKSTFNRSLPHSLVS